ncbi:MAG TPA: hypothetical protein VFJ16_31740 [Longimicrobium sp.]|nr:hypothetical protein [Longimicrobium sp.]
MKRMDEHGPGRWPITSRIAAGLMLVCGLTAAVALDWRPMRENDIADRVGPPRRTVAEPRLALPERIGQCERYAVEVCGTWTLQPGGTYRARWNDGATATIRVMELSDTRMVASRVDDDPRRRTAVYEGSVADRSLVSSGSVGWTTGRESRVGSWSASWIPRVAGGGEDDFGGNSLKRYRQQSDGGSHWAILDGTLVGTGPAIQSILVRRDARFADGWVETVSSRADDGGLVLRARDNGDYYLLAFRDDQAPPPRGEMNLALYHHVGSEYRELWNRDVPWPRGSRHTIRLEAEGRWLRVYWDHELRGEVLASGRVNDPAPYTGPGGAGLRHYGEDARWITSFDSFRWGADRQR